ncbi:isochorismate synthase [Gordonia paraffinivorans]|uniref:isochorismate synthase n=1 Tax=Gordonia paraffinivorans TaxID=175628 RepID=UPI001C92E5D8|nr:isochorismate synthase [Gordonia paraffinivorans]MBY4573466.1 isochorismate synthase [Gordonia paraffinivorans]
MVVSSNSEVFVLSRPHGTVRGGGIARTYTDVDEASAALRAGEIRSLTGAIPFDVRDRAALVAPARLAFDPSPLAGSAPLTRRAISTVLHPDADEHRERIAHAIKRIVAGDVEKVVLARSVDLLLDQKVQPLELLDALAGGNVEHNAFAVDLDAATGSGSWLLGASPEVLLRKSGSTVLCHPYAGSAPRSADPAEDEATAERLAASAKDLAEHAFVVDHLRERLSHLCDDVDAPSTPRLQSTGEVWHLATPIRATLRDPSTTALDLALLLGPTPAVCGTPSDVAAQIIRDVEGERGFYAGSVGWCDAAGDGEWMVAIRCLELAGDRRNLRTWAGGGIVEGSDPQAELVETGFKLRTVLNALGIAELP